MYTYDEDISNELSDDTNSNANTGGGQEQDIDINTNKSMQVGNATGQDDLELLNKRSNGLNRAVVLGDVVWMII